jgi:hypothetical protein
MSKILLGSFVVFNESFTFNLAARVQLKLEKCLLDDALFAYPHLVFSRKFNTHNNL